MPSVYYTVSCGGRYCKFKAIYFCVLTIFTVLNSIYRITSITSYAILLASVSVAMYDSSTGDSVFTWYFLYSSLAFLIASSKM